MELSNPFRTSAFVIVAIAVSIIATFTPTPDFAATTSPASEYLHRETVLVSSSGEEVFTRLPLDPEYSYLAIGTGVVHLLNPGFFRSDRFAADAGYLTDERGNFTRETHNLEYSGHASLIVTDRATHRHIFKIVGNGERLVVRFVRDRSGCCIQPDPAFGPESLEVTLVRFQRLPHWERLAWSSIDAVGRYWPFGLFALMFVVVVAAIRIVCVELDTRAQASRARQAAQARALEVRARARRIAEIAARRKTQEGMRRRLVAQQWREQRLAEEERRRQEEEVAKNAAEKRSYCEHLCRRYERLEHYEDPQFLEAYARKYRGEILKARDQIVDEYGRLQRDATVIEILTTEAPAILRRANWRMEVLARAEKIDVETPSVPQRKKKSPEEVRAIMTRWERERAEDEIAKAKTKLEKMRDAQKMLQEFDLDDEERERLEGELAEKIFGDREPEQAKIVGSL